MRKLLFLLILLAGLTQAQYITTASVDSGAVVSSAITFPDKYWPTAFFVPQSMTTSVKFMVSDVGTNWYTIADTLAIDSSKAYAAYVYEGLPFKFLKLIITDTVKTSAAKTIKIRADEW